MEETFLQDPMCQYSMKPREIVELAEREQKYGPDWPEFRFPDGWQA